MYYTAKYDIIEKVVMFTTINFELSSERRCQNGIEWCYSFWQRMAEQTDGGNGHITDTEFHNLLSDGRGWAENHPSWGLGHSGGSQAAQEKYSQMWGTHQTGELLPRNLEADLRKQWSLQDARRKREVWNHLSQARGCRVHVQPRKTGESANLAERFAVTSTFQKN